MIDSPIIRTHPCAAGYKKDCGVQQGVGWSKGGFTTKIHVVVDRLGRALKFCLTPGQHHDVTQASDLLRDYKDILVLADKGYDSEKLVTQLELQGCTSVIPCRSNRKKIRFYDKEEYKDRHLIECFFNKIKHFLRVFSRSDKKASSYREFLAYASFINS